MSGEIAGYECGPLALLPLWSAYRSAGSVYLDGSRLLGVACAGDAVV